MWQCCLELVGLRVVELLDVGVVGESAMEPGQRCMLVEVATNTGDPLQRQEDGYVSVGDLVTHKEAMAALVVFQCTLEVVEMLRGYFVDEFVDLVGAVGLVSELGLGDRSREVGSALEQNVNRYSLVLVGSVEAVLPCQIPSDTGALYDAHTTFERKSKQWLRKIE